MLSGLLNVAAKCNCFVSIASSIEKHLGNKLWQPLPLGIKQSNTLPIFKNELDAGKVIDATAGSARHIFLKWECGS